MTNETRIALLDAVQSLRPVIELPHDALRRGRFNDDEYVLGRVNNAPVQAMSVGELAAWCLIDAARSEWWYTHEKDYGEERVPVEDESCEENCGTC